ncbi:ubiquitin carboxyl-terminal hydrolase 19 isoform X2 [Gouania willdenowi]|uniref:ubiquitin carboxyl-terminal hydrolase 19 isoform X2 n=1 Tax=Gouania willdenowi TaxID=441366 RepID=UPI001056CD5F|nr:ubiquitin carboxyl-terminal hydrolase 19 isoform X2 [Gouania willdenowi]
MASNGGREAVGCRSGAQHRGGRENSSDVPSNSNKKKQKDRANQESREAKRAATAGGVLAEVKKDVFVDWKQNVNEVTVRLRCGEGVQRVEDISTTFTDTHCHVTFPDERQWSCHLQEEIEASCSRVQYKEKGGYLHLVMHKKIPFHIWPSLKSNKKEKEAPTIETKIKSKTFCLDSTEKAELLSAQQLPQPPAHGEPRHSGGRGEQGGKRFQKKAAAGDKVTSESVGGTDTTSSRFVSTKGNQESYTKPETTEENTSDPSSAPPAAAHITVGSRGLSASQSSQTQGKNGEKKSEDLEGKREEEPAVADVHQKKPQFVEEQKKSADRCGMEHIDEGQCSAPDSTSSLKEGENSTSVQKPGEMIKSEAERTFSEQESELDALQTQHVPNVTSSPECEQSSTEGEEKQDESKEEPPVEGMQQEAPEPMVNLPHVKKDSYEKGTDLMVVNVYMKGLCRNKARVLFREQDFTLIFQTSDSNFLRLHPDCSPNTVFKWQVKLRNLIQPDHCTYDFTPSRVDITLKKRHSQRWEGLEAPVKQVGGAKVAVPSIPGCMENSQPGSSQHSLPAKEEPPRAGEEKPKSPKVSPRVEDSVSAAVVPRSVPEHVGITKPELTVTTPKPTCMVQPMTYSPPASNEHHEEEEEKKVCLPGFTGLVNLGNTCFMNSVIQSLSNTRELRDYFHDRAFEGEINCSNPLGTGGRLAIGFAVLLRALWKGTHHAFQPSKLKAIVASKASQFTGYAQHDAQEFMAFLLDGLHEDLNRIQNKPYTETVDSDGRLDDVVAEEAWQRHKMRNDSFIVDLFQGQFKSKLVCPSCSKVSITFDPFLYLPVPLPQKQKILSVFYFAKEPHKKPVKFLVSVSKENSSTAEVLESIARSLRTKPENLRLAEVGKNRFQRILLPSHSLDTVSSTDMLFCFEVLSKDLAKERVVVLQVEQKLQVPNIPISKCASCLKPPVSEEDKLKRCTRCYRVGYCNQACQRTHWPSHKGLCRPNTEHVGLPFMLSVPESRLSYTRLTQLLEGYSRFSVNVFQPPFQSGRMSPEALQSRLELPLMADGSCSGDEAVGGSTASGSVDGQPESPTPLPGCQATASNCLSSLRTGDSGFSEATSPTSSRSVDPNAEKETSCEKTVRPEAAVPGYQQPSESASVRGSQFCITLLDSSNKEQRLEDKEDALLELPDNVTLELVWKNNERLKEYVLVSSKELEYEEDPGSVSETARAGHFTLEQCLNLFTKPEVLAPEEAWYCPKCQQHREASKQLLLWRLPNILIIQLKRFSFRSFIWRDKINDMVDFPIRNLDLSDFCIGQKEDMQQPPVYDLYAVINHYGGMIGGHYTAYARLPSDKNSQRSDVGWRLFDDSTVTMVDESQVVTRYAYVLFFRRRNSPVERPPRIHRPLGAESSSAAGASASQASHIWWELEDLDEVPCRLFQTALWGKRNHRNRDEDEEDSGTAVQQSRMSEYPDDYVRYLVVGMSVAVLALVMNFIYPLLSKAIWTGV